MRFKGQKEQGEWAELCFMTRAKGLGMGVLKPFGDSRLYDVAVEDGGAIVRVQVKSTMFRRRGSGYSLNVMGPGRRKYPEGSVDFFAVFFIPIDEWYIVPYTAMKRLSMHVTPGSARAQWGAYLEAWELLRGASGGLVIRACVDPDFAREIADLDLGCEVRYQDGQQVPPLRFAQGRNEKSWLIPKLFLTTGESAVAPRHATTWKLAWGGVSEAILITCVTFGA